MILRNIDFYSVGMTLACIISVALPLWCAMGLQGVYSVLGYVLALVMFLLNSVLVIVLLIEHKTDRKKFYAFIQENDVAELYREFCNADSTFKDKLRFGEEHVFTPQRIIGIRDTVSFIEKRLDLHDLTVYEIVITYNEGNRKERKMVAVFGLFTPAFYREDVVKELNDKLSERKGEFSKKNKL